ncbi:MAG: hypothetical protein BWK76_09620 [Desulfobulbaceae bacterium A2]|nr:MAG: hypothetical protein BWK76_09620 [Desulfobulbaceae bacterium A2]
MRQILVDELSFLERDTLDSYLKRTLPAGPITGVFWLMMPPDLLGPAQYEHESCAPFAVSVVLEDNSLRVELLVRSQSNLHCSCIAWATPSQRQFILDFVDRMLAEEFISV